jgi:aspartate racemase
MTNHRHSNVLGILGGLGPLASAEFLRTIYEHCTGEHEQEWPQVLMFSDPSFPDRTETFLRGEDDLLLGRLIESLGRLRELGAAKTVICCVTLHHLLPRLAPDLREHVLSLLDVIFSDLGRRGGTHLLLCTNGTRRMRIFERHPRWETVRRQLILPDTDDQNRVHHELIYATKRNAHLRPMWSLVEELLVKYGVSSFVAGCTELHLLTKQFMAAGAAAHGLDCLDPLDTLAREVAAGQLPELSALCSASPA